LKNIISKKYCFAIAVCTMVLTSNGLNAKPPITGKPVIVSPENLLEWPRDFKKRKPDLTEPTANRLNDFHGVIGRCDMSVSTAGNYHMALREIWQIYLRKYARRYGIKTWFYTTSPPISPKQVANSLVQFGNLDVRCKPMVAIGPKKLIKKLKAMRVTQGRDVPIVKNYGNVILVRKGNPKNIRSVWDLGRKDVTLVTPNPYKEKGSFGNFSGSIYNVAASDPNPPAGMTAKKLFNSIFNTDQSGCTNGGKCKWVAGKRIMHREQPWAVASGKADAGFIFYHLALYFTRTFPDKFEIVPVGGTASRPRPAKGNKIGVMRAIRVKGRWTRNQIRAREALFRTLQSRAFTRILKRHGLRRP